MTGWGRGDEIVRNGGNVLDDENVRDEVKIKGVPIVCKSVLSEDVNYNKNIFFHFIWDLCGVNLHVYKQDYNPARCYE
jgi:hypothetical protein